MFISVLCVFRVCLSMLTDMLPNLIRLFPFQIVFDPSTRGAGGASTR